MRVDEKSLFTRGLTTAEVAEHAAAIASAVPAYYAQGRTDEAVLVPHALTTSEIAEQQAVLVAAQPQEQFFEDFSGHAVGTNLLANGWSAQHGTCTFEVADRGGVKVGRIDAISEQNTLLTYDAAHYVGDAELYLKVFIPTNAPNFPTLGVRMGGADDTGEDRYDSYLRVADDTVHLQYWIDGIATSIASEAAPAPAAGGEVWYGVLRVGGDQVSTNFWRDGSAEPTDWQLTDSDTRLTAGDVGTIVENLGAGADDHYDILAWGVGTYGASAPRAPLTQEDTTDPVAGFSYAKDDLLVTFFDGSTDDVGVTSWDWDFGDGNISTVQDPTHTYASGGTYTVTLTASDAAGNTDTHSEDVAVAAMEVAPEVVSQGVQDLAGNAEVSEGQPCVAVWKITDANGNLNEVLPGHGTITASGTSTVVATAADVTPGGDVVAGSGGTYYFHFDADPDLILGQDYTPHVDASDTASNSASAGGSPFTVTEATFEDIVIGDDPDLYLRAEDPAGSLIAEDSSGNDFDGTPTNVTFDQPGLISEGKALSFAGDGYIWTDYHLPTSQAWSLTAWVRIDQNTSANQTLFAQENTGSATGRNLLFLDSTLELSSYAGVPDTNYHTSGFIAQLGRRYRFELRHDGAGNFAFAADGAVVSTFTATPDGDAGALVLGARKTMDDWFLYGTLDEVAVYTPDLTSTQRTEQYEAGVPEVIGYTASSATGYPLAAQEASALPTLRYAPSVAVGYPVNASGAKNTMLGYAPASIAGYSLAVTAAGQVRLGHIASSAQGYALLSAEATHLVELGYSASESTAHPLATEEASVIQMAYGTSAAVGYPVGVQGGAASIRLAYGALNSAGYPLVASEVPIAALLGHANLAAIAYPLSAYARAAQVPVGYGASPVHGHPVRVLPYPDTMRVEARPLY